MKDRDTAHRLQRDLARWSVALAVLAVAGGCQTSSVSVAPAPPPPVTLLEAAPLTLPSACAVPAGQPYRMSYEVGTDGRAARVEAITPPDAPACLQEALRTWIASFRYTPLARSETLTSDWMLVSARRGS
jgi:hypothetical protein